MPEHWPICWDRYRVTWTVEDGKAISVTIAVRTDDLSALPRIESNPQPGLAANIHIGHQPNRDEAESMLRTATGLLGFFAQADIDFDRPTISWEGESDEERAKLHMHSFKVEPGVPPEPLPLSFDLVARCFLSAISASENEIPLRFMAKGRREMSAGKYIDAYYSYFFFFETQFAPGFSNPKQVSAKLKAAREVISAMDSARQLASSEALRAQRLAGLLRLSDEALIDHLVATRGRLHHHALPRKTGSWHPERHKEFEAETRFISLLAYVVSQRQNQELLFNASMEERVRTAAEQAGAAYTYHVEPSGGSDRFGLNGLPPIRVTMPSRAPSYVGLATLEEELRKTGAPYDGMAVRGYVVKSADGSEVFARYQNFTFPEPKSKA